MTTKLPLSAPHCADTKPVVMELEAGTYFWCQCGLSNKQPFCDGSHSGSGFAPMAFTIEEKKRVALCTCKQTNKSPFCDGSHKAIKAP